MPNTFDRALWADETAIYETPYPRLKMVQDVIDNHLVKGVTRADVIALLGEPTDTPYFADRGLVYWLGDEPKGISVDSAWLIVDLDAEGLLTRAEIVTD